MRAIKARYYVIYVSKIPSIEVFHLVGNRYAPIASNAAGRYPIRDLGIEFGLHRELLHQLDCEWLRAWDTAKGVMLPAYHERMEMEAEQRKRESKRANAAVKERNAEKKRADEAAKHGDEAAKQRDEAAKRADEAAKRADEAAKRADEMAQQNALLAKRLRDAGIDPYA